MNNPLSGLSCATPAGRRYASLLTCGKPLSLGLVTSHTCVTCEKSSQHHLDKIICQSCTRVYHTTCLHDPLSRDTLREISRSPCLWWFCLECVHVYNSTGNVGMVVSSRGGVEVRNGRTGSRKCSPSPNGRLRSSSPARSVTSSLVTAPHVTSSLVTAPHVTSSHVTSSASSRCASRRSCANEQISRNGRNAEEMPGDNRCSNEVKNSDDFEDSGVYCYEEPSRDRIKHSSDESVSKEELKSHLTEMEKKLYTKLKSDLELSLIKMNISAIGDSVSLRSDSAFEESRIYPEFCSSVKKRSCLRTNADRNHSSSSGFSEDSAEKMFKGVKTQLDFKSSGSPISGVSSRCNSENIPSKLSANVARKAGLEGMLGTGERKSGEVKFYPRSANVEKRKMNTEGLKEIKNLVEAGRRF